MAYKHLQLVLSETTLYYYDILISFSKDIEYRIWEEGQTVVAKELGLTQPKLSSMHKLLNPLSKLKIVKPFLYYVEFDNGTSKVGVSEHIAQRLTQLTTGNTSIVKIKLKAYPTIVEARHDEARIVSNYSHLSNNKQVQSNGSVYTEGGRERFNHYIPNFSFEEVANV